MSRREVATEAVKGILRRAKKPELADHVTAETALDLQTDAAATLRLVQDNSSRAKQIVEGICGLARRCIAVGNEAGLSSAIVAQIVSEGLVAVAQLYAFESEEKSVNDQGIDRLKHEHSFIIARFLEPLGEVFDTFAIELFQHFRRLDVSLRPEWSLSELGGSYKFAAEDVDTAEQDLYYSLLEVCIWSLALLARARGHQKFKASCLWEFASQDAFFALVFTKGALSYGLVDVRNDSSDLDSMDLGTQTPADLDTQTPDDPFDFGECPFEDDDPPIPELDCVWPPDHWEEVRDCVLSALLNLNGQDIAFADVADGEDGNVGISVRNEQLLMHHAMLAEAFVDCDILDCILAYKWPNGHIGDERIDDHDGAACFRTRMARRRGAVGAPAFVAFLKDLLLAGKLPRWSPFMEHLGHKCEEFADQLRCRGVDLWRIVAAAAVAKRGFTRDCATIAYFVQPTAEACTEYLRCCLSESAGGLDAVLADSSTLAGLVAFAANSGCAPGRDSLTQVIVDLDFDGRARIVGRLQSWAQPLRMDWLQPWIESLTVRSDEAVVEADGVENRQVPVERGPSQGIDALPAQGLRQLVNDAPTEFTCALDGRLLVDPVCSPAGYRFERSTLARTLRANGDLCPVSGQPLTLSMCARDVELRKQILCWIRVHRPRQRPG